MPQPRRPQQPPPPTTSPATAGAAAGAATGVAAGAGLASPAVAAAAAHAATAAATARAVREIAEAFLGLLRRRGDDVFDFALGRLREAAPDRPERELMELAAREVEYEREFQRKVAERLNRDLPTALREGEDAVQRILDRERRYVRQREEAMLSRSISAVERMTLQETSPQGAYWDLSPYVRQHTPDCLAMAGKFWPWSVLQRINPPIHHGCPCRLRGLEEAIGLGLMTPQDIPDEGDALRRAARVEQMIRELHEAGITQADVDAWAEYLAEAASSEAAKAEHVLEEAGRRRNQARWAQGWSKGGQYRPERGSPGTPTLGGIVGRGMRRLAPTLPGVRRERWAYVKGRYTRIPEGRWERTVGGVTFTSPAGGTNIYREGRLVAEEGRPVLHPDVAKPLRAQGRTSRPELAADLRDALAQALAAEEPARRTQADLARRALEANDPAVAPVGEAADWTAVRGLRDAGFRPVPAPGRAVALAHPNGARVTLTFGSQGRVTGVDWQPADRTSIQNRDASQGPPETFDAYASDLLALADEIAATERATVALPGVAVAEDLEDHAGEHGWDGFAAVGAEVPGDVERAARARRSGRDLTPDEARGMWAAQWSGTHEALHGVNPIDPWDYAEPANRALEEALTEEEAHRVAADRLATRGEHDVLRWRAANPAALPVQGQYRPERAALHTLLDDANLTGADRQAAITSLKYRTRPQERLDVLAQMLVDAGKFGDRWQARDHAELALTDPPEPGRAFGQPAPSRPQGTVLIATEKGDPTATTSWRGAAKAVLHAREAGEEARLRIRDGDTERDLLPSEATEVLAATAELEPFPERVEFPPEIRRELPPLPNALWGAGSRPFDPRVQAIADLDGVAHMTARIAERALDGDAESLRELAIRVRRIPRSRLADAIRAAFPDLPDEDPPFTLADPDPEPDVEVARPVRAGDRVPPVPGPSVGIRVDPDEEGPFRPSDGLEHHVGGYQPGSGHFGTGIYFASGREGSLRLGSANRRHLAGVSLEGAMLYRPRDENDGFTLFDRLRDLNDLADAGGGESMEIGTVMRRRIDVDSIADALPPFADGTDNPALKRDIVRDAIAGHRADLELHGNDRAALAGAETASTRAMRALGYDGVDVRELEALDNTLYGSVLYQPRPVDTASPAEAPARGAVVNGVPGRWVWIRGTYRHIPEGDAWQETVDGVRFSSPSGSTQVWRQEGTEAATLVARPRWNGHPDVRDPRRGGTRRDAPRARRPEPEPVPPAALRLNVSVREGQTIRVRVGGTELNAEVLRVERANERGLIVRLPNGTEATLRHEDAVAVVSEGPVSPEVGPLLPDSAWETLLTIEGRNRTPGAIVPGVEYLPDLDAPVSGNKVDAGVIFVGPSFFDLDTAARAHQLRRAVGLGLFSAIDADDAERTRLHGLWTDGRFATERDGRTVALDRFSAPHAVAEGYARLHGPRWRESARLYPDALRYVALQAAERRYPVSEEVLAWARQQDVGGPERPEVDPTNPGAEYARRLTGMPRDRAESILSAGGYRGTGSSIDDFVGYRSVTADGVWNLEVRFGDDGNVAEARGAFNIAESNTAASVAAANLRGSDTATSTGILIEGQFMSVAYYTDPDGKHWSGYVAPDESVLWVAVAGVGEDRRVVAATADVLTPYMRRDYRNRALTTMPDRVIRPGDDIAEIRHALRYGTWQKTETGTSETGALELRRVLEPGAARDEHDIDAWRIEFRDGQVVRFGRPDGQGGIGDDETYAAWRAGEVRRLMAEHNARLARVAELAERMRVAINENREPLAGGEDAGDVAQALRDLGYGASSPRALQGGGQSTTWKNARTGTKLIFRTTAPDPATDRRRMIARSRVTLGRPDLGRTRITGRMPVSQDEWMADILGRCDEVGARFGATVDTRRVRFSAPNATGDFEQDHAGWHRRREGILSVGNQVWPDLERLQRKTARGDRLTDEECASLYACYKVIQHEAGHGVYTGDMRYSNEDGGRGLEEALNEEAAHPLTVEYLLSHGLGEVVDWARRNRAVQVRGTRGRGTAIGTYQTDRHRFRMLLDRMQVPEAEREALIYRWKFQRSDRDRRAEMAERLAGAQSISLEAAASQISATMAGNFNAGAARVPNFQPILPLPEPAGAEPRPEPRPEPEPVAPERAPLRLREMVRVTPARGRAFQGRIIEINPDNGLLKVKKIGRGEEVWVSPLQATRLTEEPAARPRPEARPRPRPETRPEPRPASEQRQVQNGGIVTVGAMVRGRVSGKLAQVKRLNPNGTIHIRRSDGSTHDAMTSELDTVAITDSGHELKVGDTALTPTGAQVVITRIDWADPQNPIVHQGSGQTFPARSLRPADYYVAENAGRKLSEGQRVIIGARADDELVVTLVGRRISQWPKGDSHIIARWPDGSERPIREEQISRLEGEDRPPDPPPNLFDQGYLRRTFSGQVFGRRGYTTRIDGIHGSDPRVTVSGSILNQRGRVVGTFTRQISREDGVPTVYHAFMKIPRKSDQGGGFASAFNRHAEAHYRAAGVRKVTVTANLDVGGYAWAATGFDFLVSASFVAPEGRRQVRAAKARELAENARSRLTPEERALVQSRLWDGTGPLDGKIEHSWELAALHLPGQEPGTIGRKILLNVTWSGIKVLVGPERSPFAG